MIYKVVRNASKEDEVLDELKEIRKLLEEIVTLYKKNNLYYTPGLYDKSILTVPPD